MYVCLYLVSLIKFLFECRADPPVSMLIINTSDLAGVPHPVFPSPDGKGVANTSGDYWRKPGRICHYDNGVNGTCLPKHLCLKEQQEVSGYNDTWKCPEHIRKDRQDRFCCPNPGEENLLSGEENALSNSKKLCWVVFYFTTKNYYRF